MAKNIKRILIIGHSNIGDVCHDLVVINPLRRQFPQAEISFLTSSRARDIAQGYEGLDRVLVFDKHGKDRGLLRRLLIMAGLIRAKFDLVIVLKSTFMHKFLGISRIWSVQKYLRCAPFGKRMHVVDIYLEFLGAHGINVQGADFCFSVNKKEKSDAGFFSAKEGVRFRDRIIGIIPAAAWPLKSWPVNKWNALAEILKTQHDFKIITLSKSGDDPFSQMVSNSLSREIIDANEADLKQVMALIERCTIVIGPDSGLLHLASCMGVKVIGLFGPTPPDYIYPYFHRHNVIISKEKIDCMPCYPGHKACYRKTKFQTGACMNGISVESVLELVGQEDR